MILAFYLVPISRAFSDGGRCPFAHPIHGQDGGFLIGGTEERTGGMAQMVFHEKQLFIGNIRWKGCVP